MSIQNISFDFITCTTRDQNTFGLPLKHPLVPTIEKYNGKFPVHTDKFIDFICYEDIQQDRIIEVLLNVYPFNICEIEYFLIGKLIESLCPFYQKIAKDCNVDLYQLIKEHLNKDKTITKELIERELVEIRIREDDTQYLEDTKWF